MMDSAPATPAQSRKTVLLGMLLSAFALAFVGCVDDGGESDGNAAADGDQDGDSNHDGNDNSNQDGDDDSDGLTDGLDDSDKTGNIRTYLTDAPGDFDEVWVTISAVEIHGYHGTYAYDGADGGVEEDSGVETDGGPEGYAEPEASWETLVDETQTLDLLTLQNDVTAVLGDAEVEAGEYSQLRLIVDSASVVVGGDEEDLFIPSGTQTGIKINLDFEVLPATEYVIVLDFDAAESIKETGQGYLMQPVIKIEYIGYYDSEGALVELTDTDPWLDGDAGVGDEESDGGTGPGNSGNPGNPGNPGN